MEAAEFCDVGWFVGQGAHAEEAFEEVISAFTAHGMRWGKELRLYGSHGATVSVPCAREAEARAVLRALSARGVLRYEPDAAAAGPQEATSDAVGVYSTGVPTAGIKLTLARDGTYFFHTFGGLVTSRGTWRITRGQVVLTSRTIRGESSRYRLDGDELHRVPDDHLLDGRPVPRQWETLKREDTIPSWAKVAPEQVEEARRNGVPVAFENDLGMRFVLIPGGTFLMGSPEDEEGRDPDENLHEVTISRPYYLSIHEVTNDQYRAWRRTHDSGSYDEHSLNGGNQPAVPIDWGDAKDYAEWLTDRDPKHEYRLPTEAEWERACRAGTRSAYCFGDRIEDLPRFANFSDVNDPTGAEREDLDDGHAVTAPVGSYLPNRWSLYDMHGNAWEWCSDWYAAYPSAAVTDPRGPTSGTVRAYRGGCWRWFPKFARSAKRRHYTFEAQMQDNGFRLVALLARR